MNLKTRICIFSVFVLLTSLASCVMGQEFIAPFFKAQQNLLQEKVYIHTDKPYYTVGDTIYFRGTLVNADTHSLVVKTNYIYVELYGKDGKKPLFRKKLKRDNLCFHNRFILPDTLQAGKYTLQAYTNWMRNFDGEKFFSRSLYIVNMGNTVGVDPVKKKEKRDYAVTFFPEGGSLLSGQSQRIAFKVQGSDGYSESADGRIENEQGEVLVHFSTLHDGMGSFLLKVPVGGRLKAVVMARKDSMRKEFILPPVVTQGVALSVVAHEKKLAYKVLGNADTPLSLIVHSRGKLLDVRKLSAAKMEGELSTSTYPDGIVQLLVCNAESGQAVSRRLSFIRNGGQEKWTVFHDKPLTAKREKVIVDLQLKDGEGNPLRGDFSVSVIDAGQVTARSHADNIVSNLLMTSDLKGYVENPAWYFDRMDKNKREALDLVMLTHGWSRFSTDYITAAPQLPSLDYKLEVGQYISGRVDGVSEKDRNSLISITDGERSFVSGKLDGKGNFYFDGIEYPDSLLLKARIATTDKRSVRLRFDQYPSPGIIRKEPSGILKNAWENDSSSSGRMITAEGINIVDLPEVVIAKSTRVNSIMGNVWVDDVWDFDETRLKEEFGDNLNRTANNAVRQIAKDRAWLDGISTVVVNDMPYKGSGILTDINASDIERLTFIRKEYNTLATDLYNAGGAIVITLKPGASIYKQIEDQRKVSFSLLGYAWPEYFYHPVYDTPEKKSNTDISDWRTTIYWNPSIQPDEKGHRKIAFFTSDRPGNYHIVIEGITLKGQPVWHSSPL